MTQSIIDALTPFCESPPDDLVAHFAGSQMPCEPSLMIRILSFEEALEYTDGIQQSSILGKPFGLIALDDAENSNPYCYVTNGPTRGSIMSLCHDEEPAIAFSSLKDFVAAIENAIEADVDIDDLPHDDTLTALDRTAISKYVSRLLLEDGLCEEICVLVDLIPTSDIDLATALAQHPDFYVREALAIRIAKSPNADLVEVATKLSVDDHPQVAEPGKRALSAVKRAIHNANDR